MAGQLIISMIKVSFIQFGISCKSTTDIRFQSFKINWFPFIDYDNNSEGYKPMIERILEGNSYMSFHPFLDGINIFEVGIHDESLFHTFIVGDCIGKIKTSNFSH